MSFNNFSFLYQTRTILRLWQVPTVAVSRPRSFHAIRPRQVSNSDDIPFVIDQEAEEKKDAPPEIPKPRGTITPSEQATFDRIWADIAARGLQPRSQLGSEDTADPNPKAQQSIHRIIGAAASGIAPGSAAQQPPFILSPALQATGAKDPSKAALRLPASLRSAAEKARVGLDPSRASARSVPANSNDAGGQEIWETKPNTFERDAEVVGKRLTERKRIGTLMHAAKSDFELWDVMEKEVFALPDRLNIRKPDTKPVQAELANHNQKMATKQTEEPVGTGKAQNLKGSKGKEMIASTEIQEPDEPAKSKLNLYVYGPLYPEFLVEGIRLLDTSFASSSRLALNVLPRIKELGLESYILGVSTPLYNELLEILYGRYGDLANMLGLLEEMRHSGLYFDESTVSILHRVENQMKELVRGKMGGFAQAIMTMPEFEQSLRERIRYWQSVIDTSMKQDVDMDYSKLVSLGQSDH